MNLRNLHRYGNTCSADDPESGVAVSAVEARLKSGRWLFYKLAATRHGKPMEDVEEVRQQMLALLQASRD